jgi:hypothetical protein
VGGWVRGYEGDAGTNDYRGATSSLSNEKLFVAMRADDERERLERMWEEVEHCQMCF